MSVTVRLRELTAADLPTFFQHQCDPVAVRMAAFTAEDPTDHAAFQAHWQKVLADDRIVKKTVTVDDAVAGHLAHFERDGAPEITYWIGREFWGRGVATAAVRAFLAGHPARPVYARAAADNAASIRVLEKCGFVLIARERGFANARGAEIDEVVLRRDD